MAPACMAAMSASVVAGPELAVDAVARGSRATSSPSSTVTMGGMSGWNRLWPVVGWSLSALAAVDLDALHRRLLYTADRTISSTPRNGAIMTDKSYHVYVIQGRGQRDYADCQAALAPVPAQMTALPFIGTEDELIAKTRDADGLVISSSPVTRTVMSALEGLKVVARTGVGYDVIDVPAATELGVIVVNIPDIWVREVANHALALLLAWNRKIVALDRQVHAGTWGGGRARPPHRLAARRDGRHRRARQHRQRVRAAHRGASRRR